MTQTSLDGGVWLNKFHDTYRLFSIETLYINDQPQKNVRAIGDIPLPTGTSEHKVFKSTSRADLKRQIIEWYGDSRRDESMEEWGKGNPKDAHNYIVAHPEINGAIFKWTWDHRAKYVEQGFTIKTYVNDIDAEYSFAGLRGDLVDFLSKYDCWDWAFCDECEATIDEYGILHLEHEADDPNCYDHDYYDDSLSFPDVGPIIDNANEDLREFVSNILWDKVKEGELTEGMFKYKLREAGF